MERIQCGYEDECKNKSCLNCRKKGMTDVGRLTIAEMTCIEDFGIIDLGAMRKNKPKELNLMQRIMWQLNKKVWKEEDKS